MGPIAARGKGPIATPIQLAAYLLVLAFLKQKFRERVVSPLGEKLWPPYSPNLNPLIFFAGEGGGGRLCVGFLSEA